MAEPTDEQLKQYADKLPWVYRTALEAFIQKYEDGTAVRRAGTPVKYQRIRAAVIDLHPAIEDDDMDSLLQQLVEKGFLIRIAQDVVSFFARPNQRYIPTPLGERLIQAVTGIEPVPEALPELPQPAWA